MGSTWLSIRAEPVGGKLVTYTAMREYARLAPIKKRVRRSGPDHRGRVGCLGQSRDRTRRARSSALESP